MKTVKFSIVHNQRETTITGEVDLPLEALTMKKHPLQQFVITAWGLPRVREAALAGHTITIYTREDHTIDVAYPMTLF